MKKTAKSILALVLTLVMVFSISALSVSAYTLNGEYVDYTMSIANQNVVAGTNQITVPVKVNDLYGVLGISADVTYDSTNLEFVSADVDSHFTAYFSDVQDVSGSTKKYTVVASSKTNKTINEKTDEVTLVTLTFNVINDPAENTGVALTPSNATFSAVKEANAGTAGYDSDTDLILAAEKLTAGTVTLNYVEAVDKKIVSFENAAETVDYNTASDALNVPTELTANLEGGTTATVPVTFDVSSYDPTKTDAPQVFNGVVGQLPANVVNTDNVVPTYTVTVNPQVVTSDVSIQAENKTVDFNGGEIELPITITGTDSANGVQSVGMTITLDDNETFAGIKGEGEADYTLGTSGEVVSGDVIANVNGKTVTIAVAKSTADAYNSADAVTMFTLKLTVAGNATDVDIVDTITLTATQVVSAAGTIVADVATTNPTVTITPENRQYTMGDVRNVMRHYVGLTVAEFDQEWLDINDDGTVDLVDAVLIIHEIENY